MGNANNSSFNAIHNRNFSHVFLFVNPASGGNCGAKLTNMGIDVVHWKDSDVELRIFNLKDKADRERGISQLRDIVPKSGVVSESTLHPVAVAAGGDGTVKWLITLLKEGKCSHIPIGIIPFGTGNDLARVLGWGGSAPNPLIGKHMEALREHVIEFSKAKAIPLDVWEVTIETKPGGCFKKVVDGKTQVQTEMGTKISEFMINYFSIGADAQVVWSFEKHRKSSQLGNRAVYALFGGKQTLPFVELPTVSELVDSMVSFRSINSPVFEETDLIESDKYIETCSIHNEYVQCIAPQSRLQCHTPQPNAYSLIWQNIPSYGGGNNIWGLGIKTTSVPVQRIQPKPTRKSGFFSKRRYRHSIGRDFFSEQCVNDGKLELITVDKTRHIASYAATGGLSEMLSENIHREKQSEGYSILLKYRKAYMQIDGEGLRIDLPHRVVIKRRGQVLVLASVKKDGTSSSSLYNTPSWKTQINENIFLDKGDNQKQIVTEEKSICEGKEVDGNNSDVSSNITTSNHDDDSLRATLVKDC